MQGGDLYDLEGAGERPMFRADEPAGNVSVQLYWIPLGADGWFVKRNGRLYEALVASRDRRPRRDLYHSALEVVVPEGRFVIEQAPAARGSGARGVVAEGPVGVRPAGRLRLSRYEVRCWRGGRIPDMAEAVESPRRLSGESAVARRVLDLVPHVPTPVWGRDELHTGDMWNSNSVVSWLITRSGLDLDEIPLPTGGRAPGWDAGIAAARRNLVGPGLRPADIAGGSGDIEQMTGASAHPRD
jgi:hypothetical protein